MEVVAGWVTTRDGDNLSTRDGDNLLPLVLVRDQLWETYRVRH
jgi:hypothetical protein